MAYRSRVVLDSSCLIHTYVDELPFIIFQFTMVTITLAVVGTPLTLLCTVPALKKMKQAQQEAAEGKIEAARKSYNSALRLRLAVTFFTILFMIAVATVVGVTIVLV